MAFKYQIYDADALLAQSLAMQDFMDTDHIPFSNHATNNHNIHRVESHAAHHPSDKNSKSKDKNPKPPPKILNQQCLPLTLSNYISSRSIISLSEDISSTNPDIYNLFFKYNYLYFDNKLSGCEVKWSKRMTLCAGLCCYEGCGGLCSIKLSSPLLKYRSTKEMIETLIHEMIHAFLFVTMNNRDRESHGDRFKSLMNSINYVSSLNISIYHTFHDEVDACRKHIWKCNGCCQYKSPYFGIVKRAMNRAPSANDNWWGKHMRECGGTYTKISEPKEFTEKQKKKKEREERKKLREERKRKGINIKKVNKKKKVSGKKRKKKEENVRTLIDMFGAKSCEETFIEPVTKRQKSGDSDIEVLDNTNNYNERKVECPICHKMFGQNTINSHLDTCLM